MVAKKPSGSTTKKKAPAKKAPAKKRPAAKKAPAQEEGTGSEEEGAGSEEEGAGQEGTGCQEEGTGSEEEGAREEGAGQEEGAGRQEGRTREEGSPGQEEGADRQEEGTGQEGLGDQDPHRGRRRDLVMEPIERPRHRADRAAGDPLRSHEDRDPQRRLRRPSRRPARQDHAAACTARGRREARGPLDRDRHREVLRLRVAHLDPGRVVRGDQAVELPVARVEDLAHRSALARTVRDPERAGTILL